MIYSDQTLKTFNDYLFNADSAAAFELIRACRKLATIEQVQKDYEQNN